LHGACGNISTPVSTSICPVIRPRWRRASLRQAFNRARRFFEFTRTELGRCDLARVDQGLLNRYAKMLRDARCRPVIVAQLVAVVFDLYTYRARLPTAGLAIEPWPGRVPSQVAGYRFVPGENLTPRIPEEVMTPLLAWSLRYVTVFAQDILAARYERLRLEERQAELAAADAALSPDERWARRRSRLADYLEERRRRGRGVPVWTTAHNGKVRRDPVTGAVTPPVNWLLLHQHAGIDVHIEKKAHLQLTTGAPDLVTAAIDAIGIEIGGMDTPIAADPDTGRPWRPRFDAKTLAHEERMLQAACYVLCAYLTGMRDCEVQAMRAGCLLLTRSADGVIERYRIRSVAYKGKASGGERADWVTIEPVADAIRILEQLSAHAAAAIGSDTLWPVLDRQRGSKDHISAEIVRQLNLYRDHLNMLFGSLGEPVVPCGPTGAPWRLTTRQFRRTIAWHIANRPFGTIAGMIQYKHASVAAFEGYAGTSRSGFRAEVEAERRLGQLDDILRYFDERQAGSRSECHSNGHGSIELDDWRWRYLHERVVERHDPLPICVFGPPCASMTRGDRSLQAIWPHCRAQLLRAFECREAAPDKQAIPASSILVEQQYGCSIGADASAQTRRLQLHERYQAGSFRLLRRKRRQHTPQPQCIVAQRRAHPAVAGRCSVALIEDEIYDFQD